MNDIMKEKQDLTYLAWSKFRNSSGTAGSFLKAYSEVDGKKTYYKLSNYNPVEGIVGHECVNEVIVCRLLSVLGIPHLDYQLIHADVNVDGKIYDTWVCASDDYKSRGERKTALDVYYQLTRLETETPLEFCIRNGWETYVNEMLLVDFLILNRDRHGANIEVLQDKKSRSIRLAPLFDHGLSLLFQCQSMEALRSADIMEDKAVQSFVGGRSAWDNLLLIPKGHEPEVEALRPEDKAFLLNGLDEVLPEEHQEKIWEMIWRRWKEYENFCTSR